MSKFVLKSPQLLIFILSFFSFLVLASLRNNPQFLTNAAETAESSFMPLPPTPDLPPNFLGQEHYYTVDFRGNGEAIVGLRLVFANTGDKTLSTIKVRVPKIEPRDLFIYQVLRDRSCLRYAEPSSEPVKVGETALKNEVKVLLCEEYQETDYYQNWYGSVKYQKASFEKNLDTLTVTLPQKIKPQSSASLFIYYRAFGYAKRNLFGAYDVNFETLKVESPIRNLQVGVNVEQELYLRGAKSAVNYRFDEAVTSMKSAGFMAQAEFASPQVDNFLYQLGRGTINKTATNLQALESFTVKAGYADSRLKLYGKEISLVVIILVVFLVLCVKLAQVIIRRLKKGRSSAKSETVSASGVKLLSTGASNFFLTLGVSFVSALLVAGHTLIIYFLGSFLGSAYELGSLRDLLMLLLVIISIGAYAVLLLAPAVWLAVKKGIEWGVITFALTIGWLIFFFFLAVLVLVFVSRLGGGSYPIPMMERIIPSTTTNF